MNTGLQLAPPSEKALPPDAELVEAARSGDDYAFGELVERYQTLVSSLAYSLTGDLIRSEELAQEAFVVAWSRLGELREPDRFRSWLYGIARNLGRRTPTARRKEIPLQSRRLAAAALASVEPSALERIISEEEAGALRDALAQIPERYRVPLVLFYREEQSLEKVAAALDLNVEAAGMRLVRGRRMLQGRVIRLLESTMSAARPRKRFVATVVAAIAATRAEPAAAGEGTGHAWIARGAAAVVLCAAVGATAYLFLGRGAPTVPGGQRPGQAPAVSGRAVPQIGSGQPSTAVATEEPRSASRGTTIFAFDFEDGNLPPLFNLGHVSPGPPGSPSQYCVVGTVSVSYPLKFHVSLGEHGRTLLSYAESLILSFDYWVGEDYRNDDPHDSVSVQFFDKDKSQNYVVDLEKPVFARWAHADLPLSAPRAARDPFRRPEAGDTIDDIVIFGGWPGGSPLYVDNIRLVDER